MIRVVIAPEARDDLKHIWHYLAKEVSLNLADRIREKLLAASTRSRAIRELATSAKT